MAQAHSAAVLPQLRALFRAGTAAGLDDGQLLDRFVDRRDESAFAALLARHGPLVLGACRRLLARPADVEDAFQATFLVLVRKAGSLRDRRLLGTWLYKVALRVALRARAEANRCPPLAPEGFAPAAEEEFKRRELRAVIDEEILRLPHRYRQPVVLCYLEGLSHEEAARRLGCPVGTVNSRLATARTRLQARLCRRGLAPVGTHLGAAFLLRPGAAAVPAALLQTTLQSALRAAQGKTVVGAAAAQVALLTEGVLRATMTSKIRLAVACALAGALAIAGIGLLPRRTPGAPPSPGSGEQAFLDNMYVASLAPAQKSHEPQPATHSDQADRGEDVVIPVTGRVLMPDGRPVAGASVEAITGTDEPAIHVRTDDTGRFQLQGVFGLACRLHVSSADGKHQTMRVVSSAAVRSAFTAPIELSLAPALSHEVVVLSHGRPVEGAQVVAGGQRFSSRAVTGRDGKATLWHPATERVFTLVAWHRDLGVASAPARDLEDGRPHDTIHVTLRAPGPLTIRAIDLAGKPLGGLGLSLSFRMEPADWIRADHVPEADAHTDGQGVATVPWAPRENLKFVTVDIMSPDWKIEKTDLERINDRIVTVHASRRRLVSGRLVMPAGERAQGLLITGFATSGHGGDVPYARARPDGTFTLRVPSDYFYRLQVDDMEWASEQWSGTIVGKDNEKPAEIAIKVYPATPLSIRVTRGPRRDPVADAWIVVANVDADSTKNITRWVWTDTRGIARIGVGKGPQQVTLRLDPWTDELTIQGGSTQPVAVEFHRQWQGDRHVTGRLLQDGALYAPSPALVARGWTPQATGPPLHFQPQVRADGTFEVAFDAASLSLLFVDPTRQRSGFASLGAADSSIELTMVPTATYSGTLLDEKGQPLSDQTVQLELKMSRQDAVSTRRTDKMGRFRFDGVPSQVPLQLQIRNEGAGPAYRLFREDRLFEPGEVRENDQVSAQRIEPAARVDPRPVPLAERFEKLCRNVRPNPMHALIILQGDESQDVVATTNRLLDPDQVDFALGYLPLQVKDKELKSEAAAVARYGWPTPARGEIVLVALHGDGTTIATRRIATQNIDTAVNAGKAFLKHNMPPARDALALLTEARTQARNTNRRVWIVVGGPRCAPCFALGRWIDDHHAALEKDYIVVKVMEGLDEHVAAAIDTLSPKERSIPWHAFTEPDGTVLATSDGPLGNIGFPGSVEGIRHFRGMLDRTVRNLSSGDVDSLIKSLSP
jgi:RNA polymerase sigma factor (sigma-70 family)